MMIEISENGNRISIDQIVKNGGEEVLNFININGKLSLLVSDSDGNILHQEDLGESETIDAELLEEVERL